MIEGDTKTKMMKNKTKKIIKAKKYDDNGDDDDENEDHVKMKLKTTR